MKPNVKMMDKSKNSFIYFQLGMIATMVVVLFVLEYNFETSTTVNNKVTKIDLPDDEPFTYVVLKEAPKPQPRKVFVQKPAAQQKVVDRFVVSKVEVNNDLVKDMANQDTAKPGIETVTSTDNNNVSTTPSVKTDEVFVVVEFLPMFPSCKGVTKNNQKECFDNALQTEIFKHLKYPKKDLENNIEGTVFVQFIVDEKGFFTSIKIAENKRATDDMRIAVENAVKKLPKIIPARQGDNNVKVTYTIPIAFKISK